MFKKMINWGGMPFCMIMACFLVFIFANFMLEQHFIHEGERSAAEYAQRMCSIGSCDNPIYICIEYCHHKEISRKFAD